MRKLPITAIGEVVPRPDGAVDCNNWAFHVPEMQGIEGLPIEPLEGNLGGWTARELHAIAHGVPCACPIGQAHDT